MNPDYLQLASRRFSERPEPYFNPEDFNFDFKQWISPYTKTANTRNSIAVVLQDWSGSEVFRDCKPEIHSRIQEFGRNPSLRTNKTLETLLQTFFGMSIGECYVTNAFPYIKPGSMSERIPTAVIETTVSNFALPELELANPKLILICGSATWRAVATRNRTFSPDKLVKLPHPAARYSLDQIIQKWGTALATHHH